MTDSWASFPNTRVQRAEVRKLCFTKLPVNCGAACFQWVFETHHPGPLKGTAPCLNKTLLERCVLRLPFCIHPQPSEEQTCPNSLALRVLPVAQTSYEGPHFKHSVPPVLGNGPGAAYSLCILGQAALAGGGPVVSTPGLSTSDWRASQGILHFVYLKKKLFHEQYIVVIKEKNI